MFELTVSFNIEKIGAVFKTWLKLRIKWNFELTVFDLAVPDLYIFQDNITINSVKFSNLSNLFSKFKYFVLILSDSCVSIVNDNNTFLVFDPHSRNEEGFPSSSGTSILLHFKKFINFCTYIEKFSQLNNYNMYELTPIEITKLKKKTELQKEIQKNRSQVSSTDKNIYNNRRNDNEITHDEKNRSEVSSTDNNVFNKRKK